MSQNEIIIDNNKLILPIQLLNSLKWKYPFFRIPKLEDYNQKIINFSKKNKQLPYFAKFDINDDGKEEIFLIQKSVFNQSGILVIVSESETNFKFERIHWNRPVNSKYFDYRIEVAKPNKYQKFGLYEQLDNLHSKNLIQNVKVDLPHIITKGHLQRIVFWSGNKYSQLKI